MIKMFLQGLILESTPGEVLGYLAVLQQVHQQVHRVLPGQGPVAVHDDVEDQLEGLVDVLRVEQLEENNNRTR